MAQQGSMGILEWIGSYGAYVQFFAQLFFWIAISLCAVSAVRAFKRFVSSYEKRTQHLTGPINDEVPAGVTSEASSSKNSDVKVDGFID